MKRICIFSTILVIVLLVLACNDSPPTGKSQSSKQIPPHPEHSVLAKAVKQKYLQKGKVVSMAAFTALAGQLQKAITTGGVSKALNYCHLAALPLTDSLSKVHQAQIRRTSLQLRNPKNAPTEVEKQLLQQYADVAAAGGEINPILRKVDKQTLAYYAPIMVNAFCLQCHGKVGETMQEGDHQIVQQYYPDDQATGYTVGDIRGIWSLRFDVE